MYYDSLDDFLTELPALAASVEDKSTGYALTADQVAEAGVRGLNNSSPVATGRCA